MLNGDGIEEARSAITAPVAVAPAKKERRLPLARIVIHQRRNAVKAKHGSSSKAPTAPAVQEAPGAEAAAASAGGQGEPLTEGDVSPTPREQLVREAAYRRFEARGSVHGHDEEDWLAAEQEVRPPLGN